MERPAVSVVVCTRDRPRLLHGIVEALRSALRPQDEVVFVDSASRGHEPREIAEAAGFRVIRCGQPGASRARNVGVSATVAPVVAFTDDDCLVEPGWTAALERAFEDRAVGFVTGRVVPDVHVRLALSIESSEVHRRFRLGDDPLMMGSGANMAFRREALVAVAGFDEMLGAGAPLHAAEDKDAFWRVLRSGWEGRYDPQVQVTHRQWRSQRGVLLAQFRYGIGSGAFAAKMTRLDGLPGRRMLRRLLWRDGLAAIPRNLMRGYESAAAAAAIRASGAMLGTVRGLTTQLEAGRFRPREW